MRVLVIFGAAVRADGTPSGSLRRRIDGAIDVGRNDPDCLYLPTGGIGQYGPAEARVIADGLRNAGIAENRILIEDQAKDTLESVRLCHAMIADIEPQPTILVCTSGYHQLRCATLFRKLGYRVQCPPMRADRPYLGLAKWLRYIAKEAVATPWDLLLITLRQP